jgi:hypothetical protein
MHEALWSPTSPNAATLNDVSPSETTSAHVSIDTDVTLSHVSSHRARGPVTRIWRGILKPKERTDGTVAWNCILAAHGAAKLSHEPLDYEEELRNPNWRDAMEVDFSALQSNGT